MGEELWRGQWGRIIFGPVRQTSDGGYIIAGDTRSYGAGRFDVWLVKTDSKGVEEWNRTYGEDKNDEAYFVQQTTDGGYILVGSTGSYGHGWYDAWLIKADSNGVEEWNRTYGDPDVAERAYSVLQTTDGGYIVVSSSRSSGSLEEGIIPRVGIWLLKTDADGDEEWIKTFGCEDLYDDEFNYLEEVMFIEERSIVQQTSDGGYVFTAFKPIGSLDEGHTDAVLVKIKPETSTPGFEIFTAISSATIIAVILILRKRRV
ncbi:MAG: hypothetical protein SVM80_09255 [Halobacteriota archaeon]|nr:hypothetical protein [Halobacteriota archaeon]